MMMEDNEAYLLYYNEAKLLVDPNQVWKLASEVCGEQYLDFNIDPSWRVYISDLFKLPWETVFGFRLQIKYANSRPEQILNSLISRPWRTCSDIYHIGKTMLKASKICFPGLPHQIEDRKAPNSDSCDTYGLSEHSNPQKQGIETSLQGAKAGREPCTFPQTFQSLQSETNKPIINHRNPCAVPFGAFFPVKQESSSSKPWTDQQIFEAILKGKRIPNQRNSCFGPFF